MKTIAATELELLSFFEVTPTATDADVVWFYNSLLYEVRLGGAEVSFRLDPSYRDIQLTVTFGNAVAYELKATQVADLIVHSTDQREALEIRFTGESSLWLVLRPTVSLWHDFESLQ
jgi:hypothetical protein